MPDNSSVSFVGAFTDVHGRNVLVYQDHDGIRLDVAGIEIMLNSAMPVLGLLIKAESRKAVWVNEQAALNA